MDNLTDIGGIKSLLRDYGFAFHKGLGQNFIVNPTICPRMVEECEIDEEFGILEIGPGIGVLTKELAKRAKKVVAVELDSRLIPVLKETLQEYDNMKIMEGDILRLDLHQIIEQEFPGLKVGICGNLPYYITSPIIMHILEDKLPIEFVAAMVQKEAAERFCAPLPSRRAGAVTAAIRYYAEPEYLFTVKAGNFIPIPKVDSAVIKLTLHKFPPVLPKDELLFRKVIKAAFSQRRKTIANSIGSTFGKSETLLAIEAAGISPSLRAEKLTLEDFSNISDQILLTRNS